MKELGELGFREFVRSEGGGYRMKVVGELKELEIGCVVMKDGDGVGMEIGGWERMRGWKMVAW